MRKFLKYINLLGAMAMVINAIQAQQISDQVKLNQLGFYTLGPKHAIVTGTADGSVFYITSTNLRDTIFKGMLSDEIQSPYSNTKTRVAEFSQVETKGSFVLMVPGLGHSYIINIGDEVFEPVTEATLKGFYFQRASMPLKEKYAGKWHRSAGHPDTAVLIHASASAGKRMTGTVISSPGGWYDAGDYNKYIVNSGITMGTLLSAFEDFPGYFRQLNVNIPESDDTIPDILNEVLYNLRWMLTMQDLDGGVYHKLTNANFDGMVMPGITREARYVVQKGTAATLDFTAVMAQASRVYALYPNHFPGLADSCLNAATAAWKWCIKNPAVLYEQDAMNKIFKPAVTTGAYGDRSLNDEWLWAAAEMLVTTKDKNYLSIVKQRMQDAAHLPSWGNVAMAGYYSMIRKASALPDELKPLVTVMKDTVIKKANNLILNKNAFATIMGQSAKDFNWGGNSVAANQGILLVQAYHISRNKKYLDAALTNIDYLLGRNATGYSFITGFGSKSPMHPHHRQSEADGITEPIPGLLVGGPNVAMQDKCDYPHKEVETAYTDHVCSYASNEIAINWQAPVVYLFSAMESLKEEAGFVKRANSKN